MPNMTKTCVSFCDSFVGELGKAVKINRDELSPDDRKKYDDGFQSHSFNEFASDMVSLHRQLRDVRDPP